MLIARIAARLRGITARSVPLRKGKEGGEALLAGAISGELLGAEHLADRARSIAAAQEVTAAGPRRREARLLARLHESRKILRAAHERLQLRAAAGKDVGPAGDWLLDNFHLVQEHIQEVIESLPRGYYRELPELSSGAFAGYPRIYELAIGLISHTEGRIDLSNVDLFVEAFQEEASLSIGELWAIPAMLRLGLLENVRRMALRTTQHLGGMEEADRWAARISEALETGGTALEEILRRFLNAPPPLSAAFVNRFLQQIREEQGAFPALLPLEEWIADEGMSADEAAVRNMQQLALAQRKMANSITSLRVVERKDWGSFVERQSHMEEVLRSDPAAVYSKMTFESRDQYRNVVEHLSRRLELKEEEVAKRAIDLAAAAAVGGEGTQPWRAHVGYYLVDEGRALLERELAYRPTLRESILHWMRRHPNLPFAGGILLATAAALALLFLLGGPAARAAWIPVLILALIPANDIAIHLVNQLITALVPPHLLPRLELRRGDSIPDELRTAVVIPTLFNDLDAVDRELENLEVRFLANRKKNLLFALLSDFADAETERTPGDRPILERAIEGIEALNEKYGVDGDAPFFLFHRPRRWNEQEGSWIGWERKRGKLAEFNRYVREGAEGAFEAVIGDVGAIKGIRYVITLDSDTVLPPDAAALLIGTLAHPLHQAVYDLVSGRVVRGYGILQPRVGVLLPSAHRSIFASIHSGYPGVDPYTTAVSDVYQDLYGEGSFTGKGIYDLHAFEEATHGRFPENTLLSHDLIEGNFARAGLVSDIELYDDYPVRYLTFARRRHRWVRGDWQLLRWLGWRVPGPDGPEPNRLSLLSRWKIVDNLRRSTVEIAQLAFLVAGWTFFPGSPLRWTLLGLGAIVAPWLLSLLLAALRPPLDKSWGPYYLTVFQDALASAKQAGLAIVFLPHQAWSAADAIVRALWRLVVSKRLLLEWQTASAAERGLSPSARYLWREMAPAVALAGATVLLAVGVELSSLHRAPVQAARLDAYRRLAELLIGMGPLALLWLSSPAIAHALAQPATRKRRRLSEEQLAAARRYAELHWSFFDRFVTEETNWLAPDNFQEDPSPVVAMRTSPTNIGLQLLSTVSAFVLGLIELEDMVGRLERAFDSLDRLPKFRGHLYNWYGLTDLDVLEPRYVSTVDSGNLAGHLIAFSSACLGLIESHQGSEGERERPSAETTALSRRLDALASRATRLVDEMEFGFLFDKERKLFSIGYQEATEALDPSFYDLLASEARLASFVAVAKGDVPVEHWFRMGRTLTHAAGGTALISWSGSMFEYLMPSLVMRSLPFTLLDQTYEGAVHRQIAYGNKKGVPWGISESAYNHRDREQTYQYRAFGVPDLGLKRGLDRDLVIAPYASVLAAMVRPVAALSNLERLEKLGALGAHGFYDAVDYTRPNQGKTFAIARLYMAHHIGMSLVALTNMLEERFWKRRFHADPLVRSAVLLLHERIPRRLVLGEAQRPVHEAVSKAPESEQQRVRTVQDPDRDQPAIALLGHHPYSVMISHAGGGYSRYGELAVTRWRADETRDATGQFFYVRDLQEGRVWSATHQPVCAPPDAYGAALAPERVDFYRRDGRIETRTEIAVVAKDAAEVRRVQVTNLSNEERLIELTSYGEVVLAPPASDRAHPAFGNLFVETEWLDWCTSLIARRRPRSVDEEPLWCAHILDASEHQVDAVSFETDRSSFIGRGRTVRDPVALERDGPLGGGVGAVLDPILSLRTRLLLPPGKSATVTFTTLVAESRERILEMADRYHDPGAGERAFELAWSYKELELREFGASPADTVVFNELASYLLYPNQALRAPRAELLRNTGSQELLWANGISGDWPILIATLADREGLPTLRQLFAAHHFWHRHGMKVDVVVLIEQPSSYLKDLEEEIMGIHFASRAPAAMEQPGGVYLRRADLINAEELLMLRATSRVILPCDGRSLGKILEERLSANERTTKGKPPSTKAGSPHLVGGPGSTGASAPGEPAAAPSSASAPVAAPTEAPTILSAGAQEPGALLLDNGLGGVLSEGDYLIRVRGDRLPPAPWANVIANPEGGFVVTERGGGFSWAKSSYFYRLTPWHNDPVSDPPGDVLYLRDDDRGELWSATPAPLGAELPFTVIHGKGVTSFLHERDGIESQLDLGLAPDEAIKLSLLTLTNKSGEVRRLTITSYAEWALGAHWEETRHQVKLAFDPELEAIFAENHFNPYFDQMVAFAALSEGLVGYTGDRAEFLGRNGSLSAPAALRELAQQEGRRRGTPRGDRWEELSGKVAGAADPCAALQTQIVLQPGERRELVFVLGAARGEAAARRAIETYREPEKARAAIGGTVSRWEERLSTIQVRTPEPSFDLMLNRWALYQALACRVWARSALYQSSGAYGYRDQLQDVMALVYTEPAIAREQILRAAGRQFVEGDVQHWWHPESGAGVRTHFSDDLVWLPFVTSQYVRVTGDEDVFDEDLPFLTMRELQPGEEDAYHRPQHSAERASVYEHCVRALRKASTAGRHGLPLMGGGDWNDGMNRVGLEGRGESVWLAWFLITTLRGFAPFAEARGDLETAEDFRDRADRYVAAVESAGWDGAWYRRAYFDDGTPLGTAGGEECRIDSIAQSWSVISGAGQPERQARAMQSLYEQLVQERERLVLLLKPPFDKSGLEPGYIKGYLPGVRENGAQYTHAALWVVLATAMRGDGDRALELFQLINPLLHAATPKGVETYKVEPYVIAADVYAAEGQVGRGGWTWYTGAASWMYRVGLEAILGFKKEGDRLRIEPAVPKSWEGYAIEYRFGESVYSIEVLQPGRIAEEGAAMLLDGAPVEEATLPLVDDGERHEVIVRPNGG